jgi:hypothetical protein
LLTPKVRKHIEQDWKRIPPEEVKTYLYRLRLRAKQTLKDLTLIAEKLPEDQLRQVLTAESLDPFFSALLLPRYERERDGETQRRRFEIAALMMEKGTIKCLERVQEPFQDRTLHDAVDLIQILNYATIGDAGASLDYGPKEWINGKRNPAGTVY